jgi:hypothetical protein
MVGADKRRLSAHGLPLPLKAGNADEHAGK